MCMVNDMFKCNTEIACRYGITPLGNKVYADRSFNFCVQYIVQDCVT